MTKHDYMWLEWAEGSSDLSNCCRRRFGCIIVNPERVNVIAQGYNGAGRGSTKMCGGDNHCLRDLENISSGEQIEIGCIHAEMNAICNAAAQGVSTAGGHAFVNGYPCLMCAKLLQQAGIVRLVVKKNDYDTRGVVYLRANGVLVEEV